MSKYVKICDKKKDIRIEEYCFCVIEVFHESALRVPLAGERRKNYRIENKNKNKYSCGRERRNGNMNKYFSLVTNTSNSVYNGYYSIR